MSGGAEGAATADVSRCAVCGEAGPRRCGRCRQVAYCRWVQLQVQVLQVKVLCCSKECQVTHWRSLHKRWCGPFEVMQLWGRGRGLVATRDIKMGELIVEDRAAVSLTKEELQWMSLDMRVSGALILEQVNRLPEQEQEEFYSLSRNRNLMLSSSYPSPPGKEAKDVVIAVAIFTNNAIAENLYLTISLVNHSCAPNSSSTTL